MFEDRLIAQLDRGICAGFEVSGREETRNSLGSDSKTPDSLGMNTVGDGYRFIRFPDLVQSR